MRTFARFESEMLLNPEWTGLTPQAQSVYITLLVHPSLSMCGVADWRPKRLSRYSAMNAQEIENAGHELENAGFVVLDEDTDEVLVRSFLRHDMPLKSPKTAVSVNKAYYLIASVRLRSAVVREASRLYGEHPEWSGWDKVPVIMEQMKRTDTVSDTPCDTVSHSAEKGIEGNVDTVSDTVSDTLSDTVSDTVSDTLSNTVFDTLFDTQSDRVSDTQSQEAGYPITENGIIHNPESIIHNPESGSRDATTRTDEHPTKNPAKAPSTQQSGTEHGTDVVEAEIVDDKKPSTKRKALKPKTADEWYPTTKQILKANSLGLNIQNEVAKFRNFAAYRSKPYRNFDRAFDNWLLRAEEGMQGGQNRASKAQLNQDANMRTVMEIAAQSAADGTDQPTYSEEDFR